MNSCKQPEMKGFTLRLTEVLSIGNLTERIRREYSNSGLLM